MQEEGAALLEANALETGHRELNIEWGSYYRAEARHNLLMFGAWHDDCLVGYVLGFYLDTHPQHSGWSYVHVDALFVHPDYRSTSACSQLMSAMSRAAKSTRAQSVLWAAKVDTGFERALDGQDRFTKVETIYEEQL
jgi:GNAT superfamily N-acetyltransferase